MKEDGLDYNSIDVDERLLMHQSLFKRLLRAQVPYMAEVDDRAARSALLHTHEMVGYARRVTGPNGRVRLEATSKYLKAYGMK